jgi:hypothetical protein
MKDKTIQDHVASLLKRTRKPYAAIAQEVRKTFHSETSPASVRHYASKLRRQRVKLPERPTAREAEYAA